MQCASSTASSEIASSCASAAEAVGQQPLRRDVEDLVSAEARVAVGLAQLLDGHGAVDAAGRDAGVLQGHDLILHERDERRDDERQPRQQQGGQLIAKALAAARRHDAEHIAPGQDRIDKRLLPLPEGRKPKILPQHLHLLHPRTPFRRFSPLYHIRTGLQGKEKVAPLAARGAVSRGYKERTHLVGAGLCSAPTNCPARRQHPSKFQSRLLLTAIVLRQPVTNLIPPYQAARTKTPVR